MLSDGEITSMDVRIPLKIFLKEHRKLVRLLTAEARKAADPGPLKKEAEEQAREVRRIRKRPPVNPKI